MSGVSCGMDPDPVFFFFSRVRAPAARRGPAGHSAAFGVERPCRSGRSRRGHARRKRSGRSDRPTAQHVPPANVFRGLR